MADLIAIFKGVSRIPGKAKSLSMTLVMPFHLFGDKYAFHCVYPIKPLDFCVPTDME